MGGPQFIGWDASRYALAALVNAARVGNHLTTLAHRDPKKSKPKPPEPFPTPSADKQTQAPKAGSFAAMVVEAKAAYRRRKESMNA